MKVLVCGGRDYDDVTKVHETLTNIHTETPITVLITGGASGADSWAMEWAHWQKDIELLTYLPNWGQYGKSAGPIRNQKMLEEGKPDMVIAFPGGKGTAHMVKIAKEANIPVKEIV